MKTTLILVICMLFSAGILCASTSPIPATVQAPAVISAEYAGPISYLLVAGDGGPIPLCAPGKKCDDDNFKLQAGDGGPIPLCAPGKKCDNHQLKLQALL